MVENEVVEAEIEELDYSEMYGDKELRWYQIAAINQLAKHLKNKFHRILIVLPTGSGKTITIAAGMSNPEVMAALNVHNRPLRILFIAMNHRLLSQAEQTFLKESNIELILQSAFSDIPADVERRGWDVAIIDEAHHEATSTIQYKLEQMGDKPIIGLTATPDRADGSLIKFEQFINPISRAEAVEQGYLAPTYLYSFVDAPEKNKAHVVNDILDDYHEIMGKTIVFMRTKREAAAVTHHIRALGRSVVFLNSQNKEETEQILNRFSDGDIEFIVNCNRLGEGIDVRGCTSILLGRTVGSFPLLNQIIGRASRPDSDCKVWEILNPMSGKNLDTTVVVGIPEQHKLIHRSRGKWVEQAFDYVSNTPTIVGIL